jgi:hypothetical protein
MPKGYIQRWLRALEALDIWRLIPDYPPLTHSEIMEIEERMQADGRLTRAELERLEQHTPIIDGELLMTCSKGHFSMKRYVGIDLSQV